MLGLTVKRIQDLLDRGMGVTEIARKNNTHHQRISRFISNNEIELYVPFDDIKSLPKIPKHELNDIFHINHYFEVVENRELLKELSTTGYICPKDFREVRECFEKDAISYLISHLDLDECNSTTLKKYRHVEGYVYKHYKNMECFRKSHGLDKGLIYYSSNRRTSFNIANGIEFEGILGNLLDSAYKSSIKRQKTINNCRPDFVLGDTWIDAKLSKSTALNYGDDTIRKYSEHTDDLLIVYALDDGVDVSNIEREYNVTFKHVSEYYDNASEEAIAEVKEFIRKASTIKGVHS